MSTMNPIKDRTKLTFPAFLNISDTSEDRTANPIHI